MILHILSIVFTVLLTLIALGLTIGGLVKKRRKLWIGSLSAFVVFSLLTVFSIYSYVKALVNYSASEEFQTEVRKKGENWGKSMGNTVSGAAAGLESSLDEEAIEKLAGKSARITGKGVKAIAGGLDETVGKTTVFADESIDNLGIAIGRAEQIYESAKYSFGLYLEFKKEFNGKLRLTAFDSKGQKMDNSELTIDAKPGTGDKVYVFPYNYFKPGLSGYCVLTKATD